MDNEKDKVINSNDNELAENTSTNENSIKKYKDNLRYMKEYFLENERISILIGIKEIDIENCVKKNSIEKIRKKTLLDGGYIWVNEILNYNGGDNYARVLVNPNCIGTEENMLSTNFKDIKGNLFNKEKLEKINSTGEALLKYYVKEINSEAISPKLCYMKLYPKYDWVIGTGVYINDIEASIRKNIGAYKCQLKKQIILTAVTTTLLFIIAGILGILTFGYYEFKNRLLTKKESEIVKNHYSLMENKYDKANEIIHDIKNHLICIDSLAEKHNAESVVNYIRSINCDISQLGYMVITGNKIIDIILSEKIHVMKNKNIKFDHYIENINLDFIGYKDLVTIIGNILDNSIESCVLSKDKFIYFSMFIFNNGFIVIKIFNSSDNKPKSRRGKLQSSKGDRFSHGYGIKNVIKTVEKYDGNFKWQYKEMDKEFLVTIMIPKVNDKN